MDICHSTHLGYESMLLQFCGKVFWRGMREDLRNLAKNCHPCARYAASHSQPDVEVSHVSLFDSFPSRDIHVDFATFGGENYIILADRLTGYLD